VQCLHHRESNSLRHQPLLQPCIMERGGRRENTTATLASALLRELSHTTANQPKDNNNRENRITNHESRIDKRKRTFTFVVARTYHVEQDRGSNRRDDSSGANVARVWGEPTARGQAW